MFACLKSHVNFLSTHQLCRRIGAFVLQQKHNNMRSKTQLSVKKRAPQHPS
ncbi:hypothetical protein DsansV1_C15g0133281 [Dioscorea sansibarensis]